MAPFSTAQLRSLALIPKITGTISIFFSALIVMNVLRDKEKRRKTYHRLLVGISIADISASFWLALSTWPIPSTSSTLWAVGNDTTCTVQGFFTQLGICSSFYNASLSIYYVLVIVFGWRENRILKIEWLLHGVPILWALGTATAGVFLDIYGNANLWCFISATYDKYRWGFFYAPLWLNILIVTVNAAIIWNYVRKIEAKADRWRFQNAQRYTRGQESSVLEAGSMQNPAVIEEAPGRRDDGGVVGLNSSTTRSSSPRRQSQSYRNETIQARRGRTKRVANQSFLYASAFYINWLALSITRMLQTINGKVYYPLLLIAVITVPMQGLPNFLVYLWPKLQKLREERKDVRLWVHVVSSLRRPNRQEAQDVLQEDPIQVVEDQDADIPETHISVEEDSPEGDEKIEGSSDEI